MSERRPDISIILPYWERSDALVASLSAFAARYLQNGLLLEVVIADDGTPTAPATEALLRLNDPLSFPVHVGELPRKAIPKSPSVPINRAVEASSGAAIFISSLECLHDQAVLGEGPAAHLAAGLKSVIVCAVHDDDSGQRFSHSLHAPNRYHFANLLSRQQSDEVGGFDDQSAMVTALTIQASSSVSNSRRCSGSATTSSFVTLSRHRRSQSRCRTSVNSGSESATCSGPSGAPHAIEHRRDS